MKLAVLCLLAVGGLAAEESVLQTAFVDFLKTYNKEYPVEEFFNRYEIFKANYERIQAHNQKQLSWQMGINQFADLTSEEFQSVYIGKIQQTTTPQVELPQSSRKLLQDPSLDWRSKGAVPPVRNQGQCGACWAFTTVAAVEAACYIATHNLTLQSIQMLVDCSGSCGNQGCNGGYLGATFGWMAKNPLATDSCYPYNAQTGKCKTSCPPIKWCVVTGWKNVKSGDEADVMTALNDQPLAASVNAENFQFYKSGVLDGKCDKTADFSVLLIGYGTDSGKQYWTAQSSWGTSWGEQGYIRLIRGKDECGIADGCLYPTVKSVP